MGRALRIFAKRDEVVIATKFLPRTDADIEAGISGQQHIERMVNKSLENLGVDYIDLYIYHMWDYRTPLYDVLEGLNNAVKKRKGTLYRYFQLFCMAAGKGKRTGRAGRLCKVHIRSGTL